MGHFYTTVIGIGRTRDDAESAAIGEFLYEEGNRHNVRGISNAVLLESVPPLKEVHTRRGPYVYITREPDPSAPLGQWLERWQFELHTHT
jgi:hypothetical protein